MLLIQCRICLFEAIPLVYICIYTALVNCIVHKVLRNHPIRQHKHQIIKFNAHTYTQLKLMQKYASIMQASTTSHLYKQCLTFHVIESCKPVTTCPGRSFKQCYCLKQSLAPTQLTTIPKETHQWYLKTPLIQATRMEPLAA
jgi:hypothetical protein